MTLPTHITAAIKRGDMTYCGEAQLSNYGDTANKGLYVEFYLDDGPDGNVINPFRGLSKGREKGQRFGLIAVPLGDDDAVEASEPRTERKPAATRAEKARRLCGVVEFQKFILGSAWQGLHQNHYERTSDYVKQRCGVKSKLELDQFHGRGAGEPSQIWDALLAEYEQQTGRMAERHG